MDHTHLHRHRQRQKRDFVRVNAMPPAPEPPQADTRNALQRVPVRTSYTTMPPTFTGEIGGYSTLGQPDPAATQQTHPQRASFPNVDSSNMQPDAAATVIAAESKQTESPKPLATPASLKSTPALDNKSNSPTTMFTKPAPTFSLSTLTSTAQSASSTSKNGADQGSSPTVKAGIAFGVLGGVLLIGMMIFFVFNRRKRQIQRRKNRNNNEKPSPDMDADALARMPTRKDTHPPRVSLRPVTQFLPNWNLDKNTPRGAAMNMNHDRPGTSDSSHPNNPFGSGAERLNTPNGPTSAARDPWAANGHALNAAAGLTRKTSLRKDNQRDADLTLSATQGNLPPSPSGTEFSMSLMPMGASNPPSNGAAVIAAAGGPPSSTVHRVQLDFKPTLDDEMELHSGDLIRLLHEYDDGWALCIRLDRSQQGVVPRTCLSTRPVKPRAPEGASRPGPPINPQGGYPRGNGQPPRPMAPPQDQRFGQGMGPRNGPLSGPSMNPGPRPQSPGPRYGGMNPYPKGPLGPSPMMNGPQSPQGKSVGRKPVPGQAY